MATASRHSKIPKKKNSHYWEIHVVNPYKAIVKPKEITITTDSSPSPSSHCIHYVAATTIAIAKEKALTDHGWGFSVPFSDSKTSILKSRTGFKCPKHQMIKKRKRDTLNEESTPQKAVKKQKMNRSPVLQK